MTIIAYVNDLLIADRCGRMTSGAFAFYAEVKKLRVSADQTMAFTTCGQNLLERHEAALFDLFKSMLVKFHQSNKLDVMTVPKEWDKFFRDRAFILMTRDHVFCTSYQPEFYEIDVSDSSTSGTVQFAFRVAMEFYKDPIKAAKEAVKFTYGNDSVIDSFSRLKLKPLKIPKPTEVKK